MFYLFKKSADFVLTLLVGLPVFLGCAGLGLISGIVFGTWIYFSRDLPFPDLSSYTPKSVSEFYADDGTIIGRFYSEKRYPTTYNQIPDLVRNAFIAAEDSRFFQHSGVDFQGIARALIKNVETGEFSQGGSTITQQLVRNIYLSKEKKLSRKIREVILALRLEMKENKEKILETYLNEIYLGKGAYGVVAGAETFLGKKLDELTVGDAALLAALVRNPSKYSQNTARSELQRRRNLVLAQMVKSGFVDQAVQFRERDKPIRFANAKPEILKAEYFTEAVRQYIVKKYGEARLYNDGLKVWTTCDLNFQKKASESVLEGARQWEERQGRPAGLIRRMSQKEAREYLSMPHLNYGPGDSVHALVEKCTPVRSHKSDNGKTMFDCKIALPGKHYHRVYLWSKIPYRTNDQLSFKVQGSGTRTKLVHVDSPQIESALVNIENRTGYVRALVGGLNYDRSSFNRAVDSLRQPGSAFKPLVYTAALEWANYSPTTRIVDEPIAVRFDPNEEEWIPANADGGFRGSVTMKQALASSRNIPSIKILLDLGIDSAVDMARNLGIQTPLKPIPSIVLGASEVTPIELTSAYSVFPNMGIKVSPVFVKRVEDRFGNVLEDNTVSPLDSESRMLADLESGACLPGPLNGTGDGGDEFTPEMVRGRLLNINPVFCASGDQESSTNNMKRVLSPQAAYLMLSMLREVTVSGTASSVTKLKREDLAGKTGTTDNGSDAWFIGFNREYTTGVWLGHDAVVSLGPNESGSRSALPIWTDFMSYALSTRPALPYPPPPGLTFANAKKLFKQGKFEEFLSGSPDYPKNRNRKKTSPLDTVTYVQHSYVDPATGYPMAIDYSPYHYGGSLKIISGEGKVLGFAAYGYNEQSRLSLYRQQGLVRNTTYTDNRADISEAAHSIKSINLSEIR